MRWCIAPLVLLAASPAWAESASVALRGGNHAGFGRVVFDLPPNSPVSATAEDGGVVVRFAGQPGTAPRPPRNVRAIELGDGLARLVLMPGATWRALRLGDRLVVDLLDPVETPPAPMSGRRLWSGPPPRPHAAPPPPAATATAPIMVPGQPAPTPPTAAPPAASPVPVAQVDLPQPGGPVALAAADAAGTLALPFAPGTGAAAFRRGDTAMVVFDEARPIDLAALHGDRAFADAQVQILPTATVLRFTLPPGAALRLTRDKSGWTLRLAPPDAPPLAPIRPMVAGGALRLPSPSPGHVVSLPDTQSGGVVLVGTEKLPGEGIAVSRHTPDFTLLGTFQGVAVEPISDNTVLRAAPPGFVLEGDGGRALAVEPDDAGALAAADAARLTRRWDFPALPQAALLRRAQAATDEAANAPPQARAARRLVAVQAQLALGLGAEAESLARLAQIEDGRAAAAPDAPALAAIAALLAGRGGETAALDDPRLSGSDEMALWRALRRAEVLHDAPAAAPVLAATLPLLLAYPAPLRDRLLPVAAEALVQGGEHDAARRLFAARPDDATLDYARALLDEAEGHAAPALATLDRLARSSDRGVWARAAVRAAEVRLKFGGLTPAQAADALDRLIYAWRGDGRELALRLRVAELRAQSGDWRAALALLRDAADGPAAQSWPDQRDAVRARMRTTFAAALEADAKETLPPFDLVTLLGDNADLLPDGDAGQAVAARLADRLAALDLPGRAVPLLQKLMNGTRPGGARAEFGARLAAMALDQGDATAALTALSVSAAPDLGDELTERRTLIFARATAARGGLRPALDALAALDTPAAEEVEAGLLETAKNWPAAEAALARYAARGVPAQGALAEPAARILLRLAAAAVQAGDEAMLAQLHAESLPRIADGKLADMLRLLTASPLRGVPDLPRAAQEAALARTLPAALSALAPPRP